MLCLGCSQQTNLEAFRLAIQNKLQLRVPVENDHAGFEQRSSDRCDDACILDGLAELSEVRNSKARVVLWVAHQLWLSLSILSLPDSCRVRWLRTRRYMWRAKTGHARRGLLP